MRLADTDKALLHADPRYQAIRAAEDRLQRTLADLRAAAEKAFSECEAATGKRQHARPYWNWDVSWCHDEELFERLRPRGDKVRIAQIYYGKRQTEREAEIESVSEAGISIREFWGLFSPDTGAQMLRTVRERKHAPTIHPDDLARINSGELKGWRQKPWGQE